MNASATFARLRLVMTVCIAMLCSLVGGAAGSQEVSDRPPAPDETLIYVIRRGRLLGESLGSWVALDDKIFARIGPDEHTVLRASAGSITLSLIVQGRVIGRFAVDDRPGEVVYLLHDARARNFMELSAKDGLKWIGKSDRVEPLDAPIGNGEYAYALLNIGELGFETMRRGDQLLEPDASSAIITFLQRRESNRASISIWSTDGYLGDIESEEYVQLRVGPGRHYYLVGNLESSILRADVEAGKRYYVWVDVGAWLRNTKLIPIRLELERDLNDWLDDAQLVVLDTDALTPRIQERIKVMIPFVVHGIEEAMSGHGDVIVVGDEDAF